MDPRDNASAARSCLILLVVGAVISLIICAVLVLTVLPYDILPQPTPRPEDQRGTVAPTADTLQMSVVDVGQGACVVVIAPDGTVLVADAGRSGERIERDVVPYLRSLGVTVIDYLVVTNPDQDHIGGMPRLMELMPVRNWVDPVVSTTNQTYARALEMVAEQSINPIRARRGMQLDMGPGVTVDILWPDEPLIMSGSEENRNDNSVVLRVTHGDIRMIIPGDIEERAESLLVEGEDEASLRADILVTAHHGSRTSSTAAFLDAISPTVALIPVGLDNQYGHPHDEVIQRLRFRSIRVYRTDFDGTIEVRSDGTRFQVSTLGTEEPTE